eukprot:m.104872 g.104872  ORF g.104872 m.104872 type:complete len:115 (+) comp37215_c0_seq18:670-1014(+)
MADVFRAYTYSQLRSFEKSLEKYKALAESKDVPDDWPYLKGQKAVALYGNRKFDESCQLFENLSKQDPYRLDDLDVYSNVLFVLVSLQFGYACTAELKPNRLSGEIGSKQLVKL